MTHTTYKDVSDLDFIPGLNRRLRWKPFLKRGKQPKMTGKHQAGAPVCRHRNVTNQSLPDARLSISGW
jgi:hypothetical protein